VSVAGVGSRFGFDHSTPERLVSWSHGGGAPERYEYDAIGGLAQVIRPDGRKEKFHTVFLFKEGKEKKAGDVPALKDYSLQADADYTYNYPAFDSVTAKDKLGRKWSIDFDHYRGVMKSTDPLGRKTVAKYYRQFGALHAFKLRQVEDAEGRVVVKNAYDEKGNLLRTRDLIGTVTEFEMNPQGKVGKVIRTYKGGAPETVAVMEYNKEGRLIVLTDALNQRQEWRYNQSGDLAEAVDQEGRRYQFDYDSRGLLLSYTDAEGNLWKIDYDAQGRLARMTSPIGVKTEYKTDQAGRVTAVERLLPGGNEQATALMKRAYDAAGRPASVTDALGRTAKYEYDSQGRPASTVNPLGVATRCEYDEANRLRSFWMAGNDGSVRGKTTLGYTALDQPEKQVDALGNELTWQYDSHGLMVGKNMGDQKIGYTYDKYGRPATVDYGAKNVVKYTYDNAGRPATISTPMTSVDYRYDKLGRLIETVRRRGTESDTLQAGETNVLHYSYTPTGRKAAVEWQRMTSEGMTKGRTEYLYNKAGAVAEIRTDGKTVATYSYDKLGNLLGKQLADGTRELYRHDTLGRITELTVKSASGKTLTQVAYTWDNADQLVSRTWDGKAQNYVYDEAGQLTGVKSVSLPEEHYAYDPAGNMIEKAIGGEKTAMTYDLANRLLTATGKQEARYAYDSAGRIKEEILGGQKTQYEYGLLGKVSRVKEGESKHVDYQYWPDGQTAWKESSLPAAKTPDSPTPIPHNTTTSYLWDGLALLARGEEKFTIEPHISGGVPVMASGKEGQTVVISDFLGTTLGVVKGEEFIPTSMTAFGETPNREPGTVNREPDFEGFFTGKPYDSDLKAYTFLFRNYRPELGRWTAKDPAGFPDGANNWLYVNNSVVVNVDPIGVWLSHVHATLTIQWALEVGFSQAEANIIGNADDGIDSGATAPGTDNSWHFGATRATHFREELDNAYNLRGTDRNAALAALGRALHPLQDMDAHEQLTWQQHVMLNLIGQSPDREDYRPERLANTRVRTLAVLRAFAE
jgi:RHS repeat-associated protein